MLETVHLYTHIYIYIYIYIYIFTRCYHKFPQFHNYGMKSLQIWFLHTATPCIQDTNKLGVSWKFCIDWTTWVDLRDVLIYGLEGLYIMIYHLMSCLSILTITYTIKQKFSSPLTNDWLTGADKWVPKFRYCPTN